jgi:NTP pyrophosphatase (non-canonical NTP hydrolase)
MKDYVNLAINTESVISSITNIDYRLLHSALGIVTEIGELVYNELNATGDEAKNKAELIGELGDVLWYIAVACDTLKLDFNAIVESKIDAAIYDNTLDKLIVKSTDILDMFKKTIYYKRNFNIQDVSIIIEDIIELTISLINYNRLDLETILEKNINKLAIRYPDKFNAYRAIHRNLDAEHKTLC